MLKKLFIGMLTIVVISTYSTVGYSIDGEDVEELHKDKIDVQVKTEEKELEIISPENELATSEKILLLSGKAEEGSEIIVEVYSLQEPKQVNFSLNGEESDNTEEVKEKYVIQYSKSFKVGELGYFAEELELKEGKNKIAIYLMEDNEPKSIVIRYVTVTNVDDAKKQLEEIDNMNLLETLKKLIDYNNETDTSE
ncbi:hypothetical protein [Caldisalinibacter kiritimatiensis]|uniref:Uncharacterized protein n=1 Tax=Caldisalinibacter kiritimatiensis TaxID=1304284 RepID=R1CD13_9FIRM|nr:hypothetical protein [Caldisalinibacter kiritimatiensis]EOD00185.1 hypothetical protein L21TH_1761 [Caldisalinibacter kiritimatiensis]